MAKKKKPSPPASPKTDSHVSKILNAENSEKITIENFKKLEKRVHKALSEAGYVSDKELNYADAYLEVKTEHTLREPEASKATRHQREEELTSRAKKIMIERIIDSAMSEFSMSSQIGRTWTSLGC